MGGIFYDETPDSATMIRVLTGSLNVSQVDDQFAFLPGDGRVRRAEHSI
jgi:hypothetical protein